MIFFFFFILFVTTKFHTISENCIRHYYHDINEPTTISVNVNIDGLPLYKNGTDQIWPILCNVNGNPALKPMIIGIFHGKTKPKKVEDFLKPFVDELVPILQTGIVINNHKITVKLRAFICDSPGFH